jgi:hypothetical protein
MDTNNFLIEAVLQTRAATGTLVSKADAQAGYVLDLVGGKPRLRLMAGGATSATTASQSIADGRWHHIVAEVDRARGVALYVNGKKVSASTTGAMPAGLAGERSGLSRSAAGPDRQASRALWTFCA